MPSQPGSLSVPEGHREAFSDTWKAGSIFLTSSLLEKPLEDELHMLRDDSKLSVQVWEATLERQARESAGGAPQGSWWCRARRPPCPPLALPSRLSSTKGGSDPLVRPDGAALFVGQNST